MSDLGQFIWPDVGLKRRPSILLPPHPANPLAKGLIRLLVPIGGKMVDLLGGSVTQVGCVSKLSQVGEVLTNNGESISGGSSAPSNYISLPVLSTGPVSTLFGGIRYSTPGASRVAIIFKTGHSTEAGGIEAAAGNAFGNANLAYCNQSAGASSGGLWYWDGKKSTGTNPTDQTIVNGVPFVGIGSFASSTAGPSNRILAGGELLWGTYSTYCHDTGVFIFAQWSRQLSDEESLALTLNPWLLFDVPPVAFRGSASTIYTATLTESATAAETIAALTTWALSLTEAASAADAYAPATTSVRSLTEAAAAAESITGTAALVSALTESATAADVVAAVLIAVAAVAEAASASEQLTTGAVYTSTLTESASAAEALAAAVTLVAAIAEAASTADALAAATTWVLALTEPATAVDSLAAASAGNYNVSITEMASALDVLAGYLSGSATPGYTAALAAASRVAYAVAANRVAKR